MTGVLREEAIAALQEAKAATICWRASHNPYVDFEGVRAQAALEAGRLLSWMSEKTVLFYKQHGFLLNIVRFSVQEVLQLFAAGGMARRRGMLLSLVFTCGENSFACAASSFHTTRFTGLAREP